MRVTFWGFKEKGSPNLDWFGEPAIQPPGTAGNATDRFPELEKHHAKLRQTRLFERS
jgi:hypothetical protein